ncbi:MAG TPA: ABC transporter ATP-binding protein [Alphaproteobacteria bacterium]
MLEVLALTKRFGGLLAVSGASLTVAQGEIVGLIGPNGAGKTTLFAMISGFVPPDSGTVRFDGEDVTGTPPHEICRRGVARTFQIVQPFGRLSVRDNIAVGAHLRLADRQAALARATEVGTELGMAALLDRPAASLTVAARKRLEIARAVATAPRLLLLDEVMAGLNPTELAEIVPVLRALRDAGVTILLIEHVMQAVVSLTERLYVLNQGSIIAEGPPAKIASMSAVVEAYLGHGAAQRLAGRAVAGAAV